MPQTLSSQAAFWRDRCCAQRRTSFLKVAAVRGQGDTVPFEQAFANYAHTYLRDRSPQLMDYELGFQLIDKNEDNDRATGVFGFQVGDIHLQVPVFFNKGKLEGQELLYLVDSDTLVPNVDPWVEYLISRKPLPLGEGTNRNLSQLGVRRPSLESLRTPPASKFASVADVSDGLLAAIDGAPELDYGLPKLIKSSADVAYRFLRWMDASPRLLRTFVDAYGQELIDDAVKTAQTRKTLFPVTPQRMRQKKASIAQLLGVEPQAQIDPNEQLQIYTYQYDGKCPKGLTEKEAEQLLRDGILIKDARKATSSVYEIVEPSTLQSPSENGLYDIVTRPSAVKKCFVALAPIGAYGPTSTGALILAATRENRRMPYCLCLPSDVFSAHCYSWEDFREWFNDLPDKQEVQQGKTYVAITPSCEATIPFTVGVSLPSDEKEQCFEVCWQDHGLDNWRKKRRSVGTRQWETEHTILGQPVRVVSIGKIRGKRMVVRPGTVFIPNTAKIIPLVIDEDEKNSYPGAASAHATFTDVGYADSSETLELRPGDLIDVRVGILKAAADLKIHNDGVEAVINRTRMPAKAAAISLVRDHGLTYSMACRLLKEAATSAYKTKAWKIKYAQGFPQYGMSTDTNYAPLFNEPVASVDNIMGSSVGLQPPYEEHLPVPGLEPSRERQNIADPPDAGYINSLMQAAGSGQKEVLDTSAIAALLNASSDDALIDQYLPSAMKGLDSIGRLLLGLYANPEHFENRYGQELSQLKDSLQTAWENNGKLVLKLKQKTIDPFPGESTDFELDEAL